MARTAEEEALTSIEAAFAIGLLWFFAGVCIGTAVLLRRKR
jgi:hypothetical protein